MFSKELILTALFASVAFAQAEGEVQETEPVDEQAQKYPEWNALMEKNYPTYSWEAVEVESTDGTTSYTKTLFHITGSTKNVDFKPKLSPVLVVGDFFMNSLLWLPGDKSIDGKSKNTWAATFEAKLLDMLTTENELTGLYLETIKADLPERYERIAKYWKKNNDLDLDEILKKSQEEQKSADEADQFKPCQKKKVSDEVAQYALAIKKLGKPENDEPMPQPSEALPIELFNLGHDVWIDGNRGTLYNNAGSSSSGWWDFNSRDMALQDQPASIDKILSMSEYDTLDYVGYGLGAQQMFYLLGMADSDSAAKSAVSKVGRFLALGVCPYYNQAPEDLDASRTKAISVINEINSSSLPYLFGKGGNTSESLRLYCNALEATGVPQEDCGNLIGDMAKNIGAFSKKELISQLIGMVEQKQFKEYIADYGVNGEFPTASQAIDFAKITDGPMIYSFVAENDTMCPKKNQMEIISKLSTNERTYLYSCEQHMFYTTRNSSNKQLAKDMIIAMKANALAAASAIALAAASLALF